jgi:DHA3 family tetracycline resistance protein-like MFS transporter
MVIVNKLLTDEIGESNAGRAFIRGTQVAQIGGLVGILISVMLASIQIQLPIILGDLLLALFLLLFMPETAFKATLGREQPTWQAMSTTLRKGITLVQKRSILLTILAISTIYGLYSEGFDRLWTPHLLNTFTLPTLGQLNPIVWFGIIRAVVM